MGSRSWVRGVAWNGWWHAELLHRTRTKLDAAKCLSAWTVYNIPDGFYQRGPKSILYSVSSVMRCMFILYFRLTGTLICISE